MATLTVETADTISASDFPEGWGDRCRAWLFRSLFTSLCGVTFPDWMRALRENRFAVDPAYWHRAGLITAGSLLNSWYRRREDREFSTRLDRVTVSPPLFVLGHWRSGTTLLHNLLALDDQFAYPNLYEVFFPHTFLCTEDDRTGLVSPLIPRTRAFDNVAQGFDMPNEDEFATAAASLASPYMMWAFPRGAERYERMLTFRGAPAADVQRWKAAFLRFLKKLTLRYGRPLLLKSPPHTGRIRLLRELFPDARFVHVYREPYTVFRSTRHLNDVLTRSLQFQHSDPADRDLAVIRRYQQIHDAYFDERDEIPVGHLHEIAFEDLEADPVGVVGKVYRSLGLNGFESIRPRLDDHVAGLSGYRKNSYPDLPVALRDQVRSSWRRSFETWDYPAY